jgi:hypothetical protein
LVQDLLGQVGQLLPPACFNLQTGIVGNNFG